MRYLLALTAQLYKTVLVAVACAALSGCATVNGIPCGALYSNIKGPLLITNDNQQGQLGFNSTGTSKSSTLFFLINYGDASIRKAINSPHPENVIISHVDFQYRNVLGFGVYKTIVYYYDPAKAHP